MRINHLFIVTSNIREFKLESFSIFFSIPNNILEQDNNRISIFPILKNIVENVFIWVEQSQNIAKG